MLLVKLVREGLCVSVRLNGDIVKTECTKPERCAVLRQRIVLEL